MKHGLWYYIITFWRVLTRGKKSIKTEASITTSTQSQHSVEDVKDMMTRFQIGLSNARLEKMLFK